MVSIFVWGLALASLALVPLAQIPLRRSPNPWANGAAVVLLFVPSGLFMATGILADAEWNDLAGMEHWLYELVTHPWGHLLAFWIPAVLFIVMWVVAGAAYRVGCSAMGTDHRLPQFSWMERFLLKFIPVTLFITIIPTFAVDRYVTLEEAVRAGDLVMTEKRLESNILGQSARSTVPLRISNGHFDRSLVRIAAERRDAAMVALLVRHGGNPHDADLSQTRH